MTPDDRVAALVALAAWMLLTVLTTSLVAVITHIYVSRPAVTKHPYTGKLYIPRSDLTVGARSRRHHR